MIPPDPTSHFNAPLLCPASATRDNAWAFVVLPQNTSESLPRRGRTTVVGTINGHDFRATLEPDGQLSHWLRIDQSLLDAANARIGDMAEFAIMPIDQEPEPEMPSDLQAALAAAPEAQAVWEATTTIARVDWIHWITSAKQAKTRAKRIRDACDMLASGHTRVCCFDTSGYYSKALRAPKEAD